MTRAWTEISKNPMGIFYGTLMGFIALYFSLPAVASGAWDAACVDFVMALMLIYSMCCNIRRRVPRQVGVIERISAWGCLICSNALLIFCCGDFASPMLRALSMVLMISGFFLHVGGWELAGYCLLPTAWCCVFIPFHEEIMLMASYPLRLSTTMLSAILLKGFGADVVYSGSSLRLADLDIAITDACSGINQLDAFILLAYIAVRSLHTEWFFRLVHIAFVVPSIIIANTLRIVATVLLFQWLGERVLDTTWHVSLGYVQVIAALVIFWVFGKLFRSVPMKEQEEDKSA